MRWPGNCLNVSFSQKIPTEPNATYMGVYIELSNPLGWYSYKVVVKQQDQDYYNIYVPGGVSGNMGNLHEEWLDGWFFFLWYPKVFSRTVCSNLISLVHFEDEIKTEV